jgi:hypothetical protein
MVTDGQVKELWRLLQKGEALVTAARRTEMSKKTARKYRDQPRLPSQSKKTRDYRTRVDPFADVWGEVEKRLQDEPRLKAKTLFEWLQETYPGKFPDSTRRTFERRVAKWRSLQGPNKPVFFEQVHHPGRLAASDFTVCNGLNVTIGGAKFDHSFFHCVLTYSNVESISLCFSESFEALSEGIQKAFWEFGGVPKRHRTDSLGAAVRNHSSRKILTVRYAALMDHYRCQPERTNVGCANENGDVESQNGHLKDRINQALLLRGSRDFDSPQAYVAFVQRVVDRGNAHRRQRFLEDQAQLQPLPDHRLDTDDYLRGVSVSKSSTIRVRDNIYSVPSRLIDRKVDVRIAAETITVTHQGQTIQTMPRLSGRNGVSINYRHIIDSLVRKPGAFANYRYREEMFPNSQFRIAYDMLGDAHQESVADKIYLKILKIAAHESQEAVTQALRCLISGGKAIELEAIRLLVEQAARLPAATDIQVEPPNLSDYDCLLQHPHMEEHGDDQEIVSNQQQQQKGAADAQSQQLAGEQDRRADGHQSTDGTVPRASLAELSGSLSGSGLASDEGEPLSCGLPVGADPVGMPSPTRGPDQTVDGALQTAVGQDVAVVRLRPASLGGGPSISDASRGFLLGSAGKHSGVWEAGFGEESCLVCIGGATDPTGPEHVVYDMQPAGAAIAGGQAGLAIAEDDQATVEFRGLGDRRLGLCATESRRDGGSVHAAGGALRARQCPFDEQLGVQQMGSDLQRCDDHGGGDRPLGSPQRDHRDECAEFSRRRSPSGEFQATITTSYVGKIELMGRKF